MIFLLSIYYPSFFAEKRGLFLFSQKKEVCFFREKYSSWQGSPTAVKLKHIFKSPNQTYR